DRGFFVGDPALRAESAWTVDAGARVAGRLDGGAYARAELVGFATWASDLIAFVLTDALGHSKATNLGRARIAGLEAEALAGLAGAERHAAYTLLTTENEAECGALVGSCPRPPLPNRPTHDLVADAGYRVGPARVGYGVDVVAGAHRDLEGTVEIP